MKPITIIKSACILMFLLIAILNLVSILTYWRDEHNKLEEFTVDGKKINITTDTFNDGNGKSSVNRLLLAISNLPDFITKKYGIIKNCKIPKKDDCPWVEGTGFVGDTIIAVMESLALAVYVINILVMTLSMILQTFPQKILYFLPVTCFIATVFNLASAAIAAFYRNTIYFPYDGKKFGSDWFYALYKIDGDTMIGPNPHVITFAEGMFITIATAVLSMLAICVTVFASYKSVNGESEYVAEGACEIKVVEVDAVAPPSSDST